MINFFSEMMAAQTLAGQVICLVIIGVFLLYMIMSGNVLAYYSAIANQAKRLRAGTDMSASSTYFNTVQRGYDEAALKGVRDVGDTEILDNAVNPLIRLFEYMIHYLPALATITGLLGTFIGLTAAIGTIDLNMGAAAGFDVEDVINQINAPLGDMATAFYTSLVGIIASAAMNIFERLTRLYVRGPEALAEVRDYINIDYQKAVFSAMTVSQKHAVFENDPAALSWGEGSRRIAKALSGLKDSVEKMSDDISSLENRGILALTNNITSLIRAYQLEHDDVAAVNESMRTYLDTLRDMGKAMDQHSKVQAANETLFEQMASTYKMLVDEHRLYENALASHADTELAKTIREQLQTLIAKLESAAGPRY